MRHTIIRTLALLPVALLASAGLARPDDEDVVVIKAGKVITATGEELTDGEIVIIDGKVRLVGRKLEYPKSAKVIEAPKETVAPGLIHPHTRLDLPSYNRSGVHGDLNPRSEIYLSELDMESYLRAGFTEVAIYPAGSQVPGVASVYRTAGPDADRLVSVPGYVRMTMNSQPRDKGTLRDALRKAKAEIDKVDKAKQEWETKKKEAETKAKADAAQPQGDKPKEEPPKPPAPPSPKADNVPPAPPPQQPQNPPPAPKPADVGEFKAPDTDPTHRVFMDLLQKKDGVPHLLLEVSKASDVVHANDVFSESKDFKDVKHAWFITGLPGQADFNYVIPALGEAKSLVVMPPYMHREPQSVSRYHLAAELVTAGCDVAFVPTSDSPADLESFRAKAADLSRSSLERADAIKAITINPAKAIGADKQLGSIEKGKDADLVFLNGDLLDPAARVTRVMIQGKIVWKSQETAR